MQTRTSSVSDIVTDEFFPELLAEIVHFLKQFESIMTVNHESYSTFNTVLNRCLFHIAKHSTLHLILEEIGWYGNAAVSPEGWKSLRQTLTKLYFVQISECIPSLINKLTNINVEQHPDLFNDEVAKYSYLPNILLRNLLNDTKLGITTKSMAFEGACMLADISGFTKLSGACCEEGSSGLDRLHDACSGYLGKFVQTVYTYNGDGKGSTMTGNYYNG